MKRILVIALSLIVLCTFPVIVFAEEGVYENAGALYEAWMREDALPDFVSGVWSNDGGSKNLTIGIVDDENGASAEQEILAQIIDDSTVTIVYQKFSRNYLYEIMDEINPLFHKGLGLVTAGTDEYENRVEIEIHVDHKDDPSTQRMIQELTDLHGEAVSFSYVDAYPVPCDSTEKVDNVAGLLLTVTDPKNYSAALLFMVVVCLAAVVCLFLIQKKKQRLAAIQIGNKLGVMDRDPVSAREIEESIRTSEPAVPDELDARVMDSINTLKTEE